MTERLTKEKEQLLRGGWLDTANANEVFAELDAVRQERDELRKALREYNDLCGLPCERCDPIRKLLESIT